MALRTSLNRPSVKHASHNHRLRVYKAQVGDEIICSGCELDLTGKAFKCMKSKCKYFLHKSCFSLPSQTNHKSHPEHSLTLLHSPPYGHSYICDACGQVGSGFTYNCSECQYDIHVGCVSIPEIVEREDHEHPLTLLYNTPCKGREDGARFICDVCEEDMPENLWVYYCKRCDYGTHVHSCTVYENYERKKRGGGGESSSAASRMKSLMVTQDEIAALKIEARIRNSTNNAILDLWDEPKRRYYW